MEAVRTVGSGIFADHSAEIHTIDIPRNFDDRRQRVAMAAIALHLLLLIWATSTVFGPAFIYENERFRDGLVFHACSFISSMLVSILWIWVPIALVALCTWAVIKAFLLIYSTRDSFSRTFESGLGQLFGLDSQESSWVAKLIISIIAGFSTVYLAYHVLLSIEFMAFVDWLVDDPQIAAISLVLISIFVHVGLLPLCYIFYRILFRGALSKYLKGLFPVNGCHHDFYALYFFLASILLSFLYFCIRYDPEGTFKPQWVERLG